MGYSIFLAYAGVILPTQVDTLIIKKVQLEGIMRAIALNLLLLIFLVPFSGCTSPDLEEDESELCSGLDNNPKLFPRVTEYCVTQELSLIHI